MLVPALIFPLELYLCMDHPRFAWLRDWRQYPWELWAITVFGTAATVGGAADWLFHRSGETAVGKKEHRAHLMALAGGGVPLFVLMSAASLSRRPTDWLMPVLIIVMATVVMISYDEFVFHRRCSRIETFTHRLLTLGNGLAFLAGALVLCARGAYA